MTAPRVQYARTADGVNVAFTTAGTAIEGKLVGDGVLATFPAAASAIAAALACRAASEGIGLRLHLGVHAGDVIREAHNIYGGAVNLAARIAAASAPGEILSHRAQPGAHLGRRGLR